MNWTLRAASWMVPTHLRSDWIAEWRAEFDYVERCHPAAARAFLNGAVIDAFELRRADADGRMIGLVATAAFVPWLPAAPVPVPLLVLAHSTVIALAVLPAVAPLAFDGEFPRGNRIRRAFFLVLKTLLLVWIAYRGALVFGAFATPALTPHVMAAMLVMGFRWSLDDQRHRCPVCLRRMEFPTPIGTAASLLLDGDSTEMACRAGHGFLHLPRLVTASFDRDRWFGLGTTVADVQTPGRI